MIEIVATKKTKLKNIKIEKKEKKNVRRSKERRKIWEKEKIYGKNELESSA